MTADRIFVRSGFQAAAIEYLAKHSALAHCTHLTHDRSGRFLEIGHQGLSTGEWTLVKFAESIAGESAVYIDGIARNLDEDNKAACVEALRILCGLRTEANAA